MADTSSNSCGVFGASPRWLQRYATTRCFLIVYGLLGTTQAMSYLYFIVTLTTIEKRFKIPSQTMGIVLSGNEVSQIMLSLVLSYFGGQRNRPRWMAWGVVFCSLSCFILAWPHFIFGAGEEALSLTKEYINDNFANVSQMLKESTKSKDNQLCMSSDRPISEQCESAEVLSYVPLVLIFMSQFVLGIGNTLYYSLGQSYLDDNSKKSNAPMVLAYALTLRMFGPALGFLLGYLALNVYIDPTKTPIIDNKDPRWLGAWWLGWVFIGLVMLVFAVLIGMFPKKLPKKGPATDTALETLSSSRMSLNGDVIGRPVEVAELKDLPVALMRLLKNKLLMINILANIFYILGSSGYITFLTKYLEVQFGKSASESSIITGPLSILGMALGFILSGYILSKYRPAPTYVFFWNVILGCLVIIGQFTYMVMECESRDTLQSSSNFSLQSSCNSDCHCDQVKYKPVCDFNSSITYFSPCHAGCSTWNSTDNTFSDCKCISADRYVDASMASVPSNATWELFHAHELEKKPSIEYNSLLSGSCGLNCRHAFLTFSILSMVINLLGATGKVGNILLNFRAVEQKDKAFAQGLSLMLVSLLALIPGPIIYGIVIDNTCTMWNNICGIRGNCQLYDQETFRYNVNALSMLLTFVGIFLDLILWHYGKNMKLYDEDEDVDARVASSRTGLAQIKPLLEKNSDDVTDEKRPPV